MAPYVAPFVREPIFAVQSRFDELQLQHLLAVPCCQGQSYEPPYTAQSCNATELAAVKGFGAALLSQMQPFLRAKPESGTWLVSCIQHDINCDMYSTTEEAAFSSWLAGGELGKDIGYRWIDDCVSTPPTVALQRCVHLEQSSSGMYLPCQTHMGLSSSQAPDGALRRAFALGHGVR